MFSIIFTIACFLLEYIIYQPKPWLCSHLLNDRLLQKWRQTPCHLDLWQGQWQEVIQAGWLIWLCWQSCYSGNRKHTVKCDVLKIYILGNLKSPGWNKWSTSVMGAIPEMCRSVNENVLTAVQWGDAGLPEYSTDQAACTAIATPKLCPRASTERHTTCWMRVGLHKDI